MIILLLAAVVLSFVKQTGGDNDRREVYQSLKKKNALSDYLDVLFDAVDTNPLLADKGDSLLAALWRKPSSSDEILGYYHLLTNLAYHLLQSGQVQASTRWYEQAFQLYQQSRSNAALSAAMEFEEYICKPLGNNYTRVGDFSKAIVIQQTGIQSAIYNQRQDLLPGLYANLSTTYFYMQDYAAVAVATNKGLRALNKNNAEAALLLYNLKTDAYLELGNIDSANYWNKSALAFAGKVTEKPAWKVTALSNRGRILNARNKTIEAATYFNSAWELQYALSAREKAKLANALAANYFLRGLLTESHSWYTRALSFFKLDSAGLFPDFTVTATMFGLAQVSQKRQWADSASFWYCRAVLNDYYSQQLIDVWVDSKSSIYSNDALTEQGIAWHHQLFDKTREKSYLLKALWLAELSKGRKLMFSRQHQLRLQADTSATAAAFGALRAEYLLLAQTSEPTQQQVIKQRIAEKEYRLSLTHSNYGQSLSAPRYEQFERWLNNRRGRTSILSYYSTDTAFYLVHAGPGTLEHFSTPFDSAGNIAAFVERYFYNGPGVFNNAPGAYYKQSNQLLKKYMPCFAAIEEDCIVSPAGQIHQLPFEALSKKEQAPEYFGAGHAISYEFSLLQLLTPANNLKAGLTAFNFEQAHLGYPALPSAAKEVAFLEKLFDCRVFKAEETTDSIFYEELGKNNIMHLASHAVAGDSSQQPFIVLQHKLYLGQMQYSLSRCPLIVLAACETGRGVSLRGEGMESLGRAFISKGVGGVVSTRWQVDDAATSRLLQAFYQELAVVKEPARALQKARALYLKENATVAAKNPWLWAAIYYQGNNMPITVANPSGIPAVFYIIGGMMLCFIIYIVAKRK